MSELDKFVPIGYNVLVRPDPRVEATPSGLLLPETINPNEGNPGRTGVVVSIGSRYNEETGDSLERGDRVVFQVLGTKQLTLDGEDYFLIRDPGNPRGILARIVPDRHPTD
jgi:co-chaperonin GroES (HSP10)